MRNTQDAEYSEPFNAFGARTMRTGRGNENWVTQSC
jgi:hypothetical protein